MCGTASGQLADTERRPVTGATGPREPEPLVLHDRSFPPGRLLVMAIVNRTPDSFYRPGLTWDEGAALDPFVLDDGLL